MKDFFDWKDFPTLPPSLARRAAEHATEKIYKSGLPLHGYFNGGTPTINWTLFPRKGLFGYGRTINRGLLIDIKRIYCTDGTCDVCLRGEPCH